MICFDVFVNGRRLCRAGVGPAGVLNAIVNWVGGAPQSPRPRGRTVEGDLWLSVGGLYSPDESTDIHPRWANEHLKTGDEIVVRLVEGETPDEPVEKKINTRESIEQEQRKYYFAMKRKFEPASSPSSQREPSSRARPSSKRSTKHVSVSRKPSKPRKSSRKKKR